MLINLTSAPLRETRQQWNKLLQTKLINYFSGSSPELLKTYMVGNGTGFRVSSPSIFSWVLKNPDSGTGFTVVQQNKTPSRANVVFSVDLDTSHGMMPVPDVSLNGRQSKILVSDYKFGNHTLLYATADIATHAVLGGVDVLVMYLKEGQTAHFVFRGESNVNYTTAGSSSFKSTTIGSRQTYTYSQGEGVTAVKFTNGVLLYLLDQPSAWRLWTPSTTTSPAGGPSQKLLLQGPYLVRSASLSHHVLHVSGDSDNATSLEAYVGDVSIDTIDWNGKHLPATRTSYGAYRADIPGASDRDVSLPSLADSRWHSADSLPESQPAYDDSRWRICNKTTTKSPVAPLSLPVLFSSDYGYYTGAKIYRGTFDDGLAAHSVNITASGGLGFGWTAWLNGQLLGGHAGNSSLATTSMVLVFPSDKAAPLRSSGNILVVVVDYHG